MQELNGNVDTRLRRLTAGELEAIVLARAGLRRLGREASMQGVLDPRRFVPAPGQGTLALEGRARDAPRAARPRSRSPTARRWPASLPSARSRWQLEADCHTPLGAHAAPGSAGVLELRAWVGLPDGSEWIADELSGEAARPRGAGEGRSGAPARGGRRRALAPRRADGGPRACLSQARSRRAASTWWGPDRATPGC